MATTARTNPDPDLLHHGGCNVRKSVECRLHQSSYKVLSRVCCEFHIESGVLLLSGSLPSYYLKQLAQELVLDLEGVRQVNNQISVARPSSGGVVRHG